MQTHQYHLSSASNNNNKGSRPASFHQENLGTGVVYRVAHHRANGVVPRPPSRQSSSSFHNRLSYRAFGSSPQSTSSTRVTTQTQSTGLLLQQQQRPPSSAMTTSWTNNNGGEILTTNNNGWINLALDSIDPNHHNYPHHDVTSSALMTLEKSYSQKRTSVVQNGTICNNTNNNNSSSLPRSASIKVDHHGKNQPIIVSNQQIYAAVLSLLVVGFPACIMSILSFHLLVTLSYSFAPDTSTTVLTIQNKVNEILRDLAVGLCTVSLATSVTSILSSFLQCYMCLKTLKTCNESKIRILLYLRSNVYLRMFIDGGFFVGVICFLLSVVVYIHLFTNASGTPSVTSTIVTVIVGVAIILCLSVMIHGAYSWLCGRLNVHSSDSNNCENKKQLDLNKNLSTKIQDKLKLNETDDDVEDDDDDFGSLQDQDDSQCYLSILPSFENGAAATIR